MRSGREAEHADSLGIDVPFDGVLANYAHGALSVLEGGVGFGVRAGAGDAILHEHAGDSGGVEPVADLGAFEIDGEDVVAASGKDDDGRSGVGRFGRIDGEGRYGDVAEPDEWLAGDEVVLGGGRVGFGTCGFQGRAGCSIGPERKGRQIGWGRPS